MFCNAKLLNNYRCISHIDNFWDLHLFHSVRTSKKCICFLLKSSSLTITSFFSLHFYVHILFRPLSQILFCPKWNDSFVWTCLSCFALCRWCVSLQDHCTALQSLSFSKNWCFLHLIGYFQGYYLQADSLIS